MSMLEISDNIEHCFLLKKRTGIEVTTLLVATALDELIVLIQHTIESVTDGDIMGDLEIEYDQLQKCMEAEYVDYVISPSIIYDEDIEPIVEEFTIERVRPITVETFGL